MSATACERCDGLRFTFVNSRMGEVVRPCRTCNPDAFAKWRAGDYSRKRSTGAEPQQPRLEMVQP